MDTASTSTIDAFLALPPGALPSAEFVDDEDGNPWVALRSGLGYPVQVRLRADRPGWRDGIEIEVGPDGPIT